MSKIETFREYALRHGVDLNNPMTNQKTAQSLLDDYKRINRIPN